MYCLYYISLVELPLAGAPKDEYTIHADNVRCTGNESRLLECQHSTEHNCIHARDVFLICRGNQLCIMVTQKLTKPLIITNKWQSRVMGAKMET